MITWNSETVKHLLVIISFFFPVTTTSKLQHTYTELGWAGWGVDPEGCGMWSDITHGPHLHCMTPNWLIDWATAPEPKWAPTPHFALFTLGLQIAGVTFCFFIYSLVSTSTSDLAMSPTVTEFINNYLPQMKRLTVNNITINMINN